MSRLRRIVREAQAVTLYHGTTLKSLDNIVNTGIAAGTDSSWGYTNKMQTFYCLHPERCEMYCEHRWQEEGNDRNNYWVVLEVGLDSDTLQPDNDDCPDCKTWQESLREIEQVAVNGSVPAYQIKKITFYYPEMWVELGECTVSEYLSNREGVLEECEMAY